MIVLIFLVAWLVGRRLTQDRRVVQTQTPRQLARQNERAARIRQQRESA